MVATACQNAGALSGALGGSSPEHPGGDWLSPLFDAKRKPHKDCSSWGK
jgi:hypothetical protein